MSELIVTSVSQKVANDSYGNQVSVCTNAVAENINEAGEINVEGTDITEGKKLYREYSKYRFEFLNNRNPDDKRRPMRLPEYLYAITKFDTTAYEYDMDDPSDVKLYKLSQRKHTPIAELLGDNMDHSNENPDYNNDIVLSPSDEMRIEEEADKESRMFFQQIEDSSENGKVILLDSSSESDSELSSTPDECILDIPCALDASTGPECITTENDSSPLLSTKLSIKVLHYPDFFNDLMDGATKDLQLKETLMSKNWLTDSLCSEMSNYYPPKK